MKAGVPGSFGAQLRALRETAGFTQEELATIAGLSVHAVSALERGERRRPHAETVRALAAALDLTAESREALAASARAPAHNVPADRGTDAGLPLSLTALLGRDADVAALRGWLVDPAIRLVTLTGPGGVRKTRLALELARRLASEGSTRVAFVPLAAIHDPAFVASAIAEALGLPNVTALDLPRRTRAACEGRPLLLVLDNFEQVLSAAPVVADLLAMVAPLRVLVTSRAPLRVRGEREYGVEPLGLDGAAAIDPRHSPAVQLFVERVTDVQPAFRLTAANAPAVTAICLRLDSLPLALELAAPWIKVLSVEDLLRRLAQDVLIPTVGPRDLPERQQTINATVAWSYRLLAPNEQRVFRRLGVLPGRFPIEAVAAVVAGREGVATPNDEVLRHVAALIDKSLLLRAETAVAARPMYQMLETIRAYAALELAASDERHDALEGLVRYCAGEASLAAEGMVGPGQVEWLHRVRDDLDSYRGALGWLIECGRSREAADIAFGLYWFWVIRGHVAEALEWNERTLALPLLPPAAESRLLVGSATMLYAQGELEGARARLTRALAAAHMASDLDAVAHAEEMLGHVAHALGHEDEAHDHFMRGVELAKALSAPWRVGGTLNGLAWVALTTGHLTRAEALLDEATSTLQSSGPWFSLLTFYVRAVLAIRRGQADRAIALVREDLGYVRRLHDRFPFGYALVALAAAAVLRGDDAWAARIVGARDAVTERTGTTIVDGSVQDLRDRAEREVRTRLGPERWNPAYAAGRLMSVESLMEDLDRVLQSRADS